MPVPAPVTNATGEMEFMEVFQESNPCVCNRAA
jgi:hypothetical protein